MTFLQAITPVLGLVSTAIAILIGYGTLKTRRRDPMEKKTAAQDAAIARLTALMTDIEGRLGAIEAAMDVNNAFQRVVMRTFKGMLEHFETGNATGTMKSLGAEIDDFLIEKKIGGK